MRAVGLTTEHALEVTCQARSFAAQLAWRAGLLQLPRGAASKRVLLMPGYAENVGCFHPLAERLAREGYCPEPLQFPSSFDAIETNARWLAEKLSTLESEARYFVVAHSMAGLVARRALQLAPTPKLERLISVCAPHRGTSIARYFPGQSARDMRTDSSYLRRLDERASDVRMICIAATADAIVVPQVSAHHPSAQANLWVRGGHAAPLFTPQGHDSIIRALS